MTGKRSIGTLALAPLLLALAASPCALAGPAAKPSAPATKPSATKPATPTAAKPTAQTQPAPAAGTTTAPAPTAPTTGSPAATPAPSQSQPPQEPAETKPPRTAKERKPQAEPPMPAVVSRLAIFGGIALSALGTSTGLDNGQSKLIAGAEVAAGLTLLGFGVYWEIGAERAEASSQAPRAALVPVAAGRADHVSPGLGVAFVWPTR